MTSDREKKLLNLTYGEERASSLNGIYQKFIENGCFDDLEEILRGIGKMKDAKYYCSAMFLEGVNYSKIIFKSKLYILFPWTNEGRIIFLKKYQKIGEVVINKEENDGLDAIIKCVENVLNKKIAAKTRNFFINKFFLCA